MAKLCCCSSRWCLIFLLICLIPCCTATYIQGTVYIQSASAKFVPGKLDPAGAAYGSYNDTLNSTGWGVLDIKAGYGKKTENNAIMFAAGYLEGVTTAVRIYEHYKNMYAYFFGAKTESFITDVKSFFKSQDQWVFKMVNSNQNDPFWQHVSYIHSQTEGLYAGYMEAVRQGQVPELDLFAIQMLNAAGDLLDLENAINPKSRPDWSKMTVEDLKSYIRTHGHCSAIVKITGAFEDVFMSHSSWFMYSATMRIYKHYDFNVNNKYTAAKQLSFSSYPGFLESLDDFYILGSGMVMLQTTNNVFNTSLYDFVVPQSVFAWQRVRVANMMASSGKEWGTLMAKYNSGTYNNQYMIVDLKRIELGKAVHDGALYVVEQIPTLVKYGDQTPILRAGYWPSYNVPFYEEVYNMSGYPDKAKLSTDFTYQLAPRAKIFRRDEGKVVDMESLKNIMRYNDYLHDPYSEHNPCDTICCRGDLMDEPKADGCYDTKVTDYHMALHRMAHVINGPTLGTGLTPFSWTSKFNDTHVGLPQTYNFDWELMKPKY